MVESHLKYQDFARLRDSLARDFDARKNLSNNAQTVYQEVYCRETETGGRETIGQRMASVCLDVASAEMPYLPRDMPYEAKLAEVERVARENLEMHVRNIFRPNTPTNINFGRWAPKVEKRGDEYGFEYAQKQQLGSGCFVIPVNDTFGNSADDLNDGLVEAWVMQQLVHKGGGGTGFSLCRIRPKGSRIGYEPYRDGLNTMDWSGRRGVSSGYLSFLESFYDAATDAVVQGNTRRGANMGVQRADHMDVLDHVYAKAHGSDLEGKIKNFNLSLAIPDNVMESICHDGHFTLYHPLRAAHREILEKVHGIENPELVRGSDLATREQFEKILEQNQKNPHSKIPIPSMYTEEDGSVINAYEGEPIGRVIDGIVHISGKEFRKAVTKTQYACGEPGVIFIDRANEANPTPNQGEIEGTNPCGEQPLLGYEACNLGSINVSKFSRYQIFDNERQAREFSADDLKESPFSRVESRRDGKFGVIYFDWEGLGKAAKWAVRFLDDVIDRSYFPSQKIDAAVRNARKIGLGYMGVWDAMVLMKLQYGSQEGEEFAEALAKHLHEKSREASEELAGERGVFPLWEESIHNPDSDAHRIRVSNPTRIKDKFYGERKLASPKVVDRKLRMTYGQKLRNAAITTQAPTGTIRRVCGESWNDLENLAISSGIEPSYSLAETSRILNRAVEDVSLGLVELLAREGLPVKLIVEAIKENRGSVFEYSYTPEKAREVLRNIPDDVRKVLVTASGGEKDKYEITPEAHARMVAVFQRWNDSGISKTVNAPAGASPEDLWKASEQLWKLGAKGGTVYRDASRENQIIYRAGKDAEIKETGAKKKRPMVQPSIIVELPWARAEDGNGNPLGAHSDTDFQPNRSFTHVAYNPVNNLITGVFQSFPSADREIVEAVTHSNIQLSGRLKGGRKLSEVIEELEKTRSHGAVKGVAVDEAVVPAGESKSSIRFQVTGTTLTDNLLRAFYVARFFTNDGTDFKGVQERLDMYYRGEVSLRSIINSRGMLEVSEGSGGQRPSILSRKKIVTMPVGTGVSKSLCPECM